jgi:ubiquinone/menaquinone biosynthesis C-methylase UbiE
MPNLSELYRFRFSESDLDQKNAIWKTLCKHFFDREIGADKVVLDLACGYGEFITNIKARRKLAVDLNPDVRRFLGSDIEFFETPATDLSPIADDSVDVVFTSNFFEHLRTKEDLDLVLSEIRRVLRKGGRLIAMGPNIKYLAAQYWDFYDHYLPLSHLSLEEGFVQAGFGIEKVIARFLPYTTRSALPKASFLIQVYLHLPIAWPILGKQFLVIGVKP